MLLHKMRRPDRWWRHTRLMLQTSIAAISRGICLSILSALPGVLFASFLGCTNSPAASDGGVSSPEAGRDGAVSPVSGTVAISAAMPKPRSTSALGTSYWSWPPTWGDLLPSTVTPVKKLAPFVLRVGGYNNDTNTPDPFGDAQIDLAISYANSIGAQIILQVPLLADVTRAMPTADTAAEMVKYTNVTKAYGVKYFSIGNEPDLYPDATGTTEGIKGFTPAAYCASATAYAAAIKAADPTIKIVGPDLSWKYQTGTNDWLTPILQACGSVFDIVAIHRYPIDPAQTTVAAAAADASQLRSTIAHVQSILQATGNGDKPLAITECNITWDGSPEKSILPASPGTVPAGMWAADARGVGLETGLWATIFWSTREGWALGLFTATAGKPQPEYWALDLFATHFGPTLLSVSSTPSGVHAYASRNAANDTTQVVVVNWNHAPANLTFTIAGLPTAPASSTLTFPSLSFGAIEIPDSGSATAVVYTESEHTADLPPQVLASP